MHLKIYLTIFFNFKIQHIARFLNQLKENIKLTFNKFTLDVVLKSLECKMASL